MVQAKRFRIVYHLRIKDHLYAIDRKYHSLIRQTIEQQLSYEPEVVTRNRKPVFQPFLFDATWEIRFGAQNCFRVFYEVEGNEAVVNVLAIGEKQGNRLLIGGEEVSL
jgi:mRNA-degrading endonuclease RelE of RelBE toxin-antitoxin system